MQNHPVPLPELIRRGAQADPERPLFEEVGGRRQSYGEFHRLSLLWSAGLERIGVAREEVVASLLPTRLESYHCWLGLAWLGAVEASVNNEYRGAMLERAINGTGAKVLVASTRFLEAVAEVASNLASVTTVVVVGEGPVPSGLGIKVVRAEELLAGVDPSERTTAGPWDKAGIIYTSGSTGVSKGVIVTWALLGCALDTTFPGDNPSDYDDGAIYCPWQQYHLTGKTALDMAVRLGVRVVLRDRFSVSTFWSDVRTYRCTHFLLAFIAPWLWREPPTPADRDHTLRRVSMVPLMPEWREFGERFGVRVTSLWASTEAGFPLSAVDPPNHRVAGQVVEGYEVQLVDEHDCEVPEGEMGELVVRHRLPWMISPGYLGDAENSLQAWRNGWLHTGDGFVRDPQGWYYFVDRLKDYIKNRGKSVSAAEVEREVIAHPDVIECACVGVPSDLSSEKVLGGEDIRIFVTKEPASELTAPQLREFLAQRMPKFMLPRFIDFVPELPRNHVNKINKPLLRTRPLEANTWDNDAANSAKRG
ncbi:MAG TPA: AMP-binding protein [Ramlibacter sp.]|nr:AMP-binding protein [Ramlibacter sp.]